MYIRILLISLFVCAPAFSADPVGLDPLTASSAFYDQRNRGELASCMIEFRGVFENHAYRRGNLTSVSGSIGMTAFGSNFAYVLKARADDMTLDSSGIIGSRDVPIDFAYFTVGTHSSLGNEAAEGRCETGIDVCNLYKAGWDEFIIQMASADFFTVFYKPVDGGQDVGIRIPINWDVDRQKRLEHPVTTVKFSNCIGELMNSVLDKLPQP